MPTVHDQPRPTVLVEAMVSSGQSGKYPEVDTFAFGTTRSSVCGACHRQANKNWRVVVMMMIHRLDEPAASNFVGSERRMRNRRAKCFFLPDEQREAEQERQQG